MKIFQNKKKIAKPIAALFLIAGFVFSLNFIVAKNGLKTFGASVFNKVIYYDNVSKRWKDIDVADGEVISLAIDAAKRLMYITNNKVVRLTFDANLQITNREDLTANYKAARGGDQNLPITAIDVVAADTNFTVLEKDGSFVYTDTSGSDFVGRIQAPSGFAITSPITLGIGKKINLYPRMVIYGNNQIAHWSEGIWQTFSPSYDVGVYGKIISIELIETNVYIVATDKGKLLYSIDLVNFSPTAYVSPGGIVYDKIRATSGYGAFFSTKKNIGPGDIEISFVQYTDTNSQTAYEHANLKGCDIKKSVPVFILSGGTTVFDYATIVASTCTVETPPDEEPSAGGDAVINKYTDTQIKAMDKNSAEALYYDSSSAYSKGSYQLVKGLAEISDDGGKIWQRSQAELFFIGDYIPKIVVEKTDNRSFISPGESTEYLIRFYDDNRRGGIPYKVGVSDSMTFQGTDGALSFDSLYYCGNDKTCANKIDISSNINGDGRGFVYEADVIGEGYILAKATLGSDILVQPSSAILNSVTATYLGSSAVAEDRDILIQPFFQEDRGGDFYSKGNINLFSPSFGNGNYNGLYVIGAGGNIIKGKSQGSIYFDDYDFLSGSDSDFSSDCLEGSVCKEMEKNIERAIKNSNEIIGNVPSNLNPDKIPEGGVWYRKGDLTISGATSFEGKGTIIVEGNLDIQGNISYSSSKDMVGFVVLGGAVNISPSVSRVVGVFYIPKGELNTGSVGAEDVQFVLDGAVVAKKINLQRKYTGIISNQRTFSLLGRRDIVPSGRIDQSDSEGFSAFCRLATGDIGSIGTCSVASSSLGVYDCWGGTSFGVACGGSPVEKTNACEEVTCVSEQEPSEIFRYDGRILFGPPPVFGSKALKIFY